MLERQASVSEVEKAVLPFSGCNETTTYWMRMKVKRSRPANYVSAITVQFILTPSLIMISKV